MGPNLTTSHDGPFSHYENPNPNRLPHQLFLFPAKKKRKETQKAVAAGEEGAGRRAKHLLRLGCSPRPTTPAAYASNPCYNPTPPTHAVLALALALPPEPARADMTAGDGGSGPVVRRRP
jgi:hypothetical protein